MAARNGTKHSTAFTVSIEAATGVTTGISAADRSRTVEVAVARDTRPADLVQPGHIFPLQAQDGGVLMRAGHTEAGCDLARMAGLSPASVICEIMKDDGTMARLPDLQEFAREHGLKIGTIADLISYRSRNESLIEPLHQAPLTTPWGQFDSRVYRDRTGQVHLALSKGSWTPDDELLVRVHEPLSVLDLLDVGSARHSWALPHALTTIESAGRGVAVLLNVGQDAQALLGLAQPQPAEPARPDDGPAHLRRGRADPARPRRASHEADEQPPPHAEHGRLRPGSHRLPALRAPGLSAKTPTRQHADTHHGVIAMQGADKGQSTRLDGSDLRVAIVQARFNAELTDRLAQSCIAELQRLGVEARHIRHISVPGALEVPVALQALAEADEHDALIALGCIIRGETYHFELVANESGAGVTRVSLDHGVPIANAILTVENEAQAWARAEDKGADAARVAVEMANLLEELS